MDLVKTQFKRTNTQHNMNSLIHSSAIIVIRLLRPTMKFYRIRFIFGVIFTPVIFVNTFHGTNCFSVKTENYFKKSYAGLHTFYVFIIFQTRHVFCDTIRMQELKRTLKQAFDSEFDAPLEIYDLWIWNISGNYEPFIPLHCYGNDVHFGPNETYLLVTEKPTKILMIYYWLGGSTSLNDKQIIAKYAELLTRFLEMKHGTSKRINIAREIEGMESDSFQRTIKIFNRHKGGIRQYHKFAKYLDIHFPSPRPNLYVIHGDYESFRIKKIPLSLGLQWLMNRSVCFVFEVEYRVKNMRPINFYCGDGASLKIFEKSYFFGKGFYAYFSNSSTRNPHEIENDKYFTRGQSTNDFKQFLEVLEDSRLYNPNEMDYSNDHLKNANEFVTHRDEEMSLFDVTSDGLKVNPTKPIRSSIFNGASVTYAP